MVSNCWKRYIHSLCLLMFPVPPGQTSMCRYVKVPFLKLQKGQSNTSASAARVGYDVGVGYPIGSGEVPNMRVLIRVENSSDERQNCLSVGGVNKTQAAPGLDWEQYCALSESLVRRSNIFSELFLDKAVVPVDWDILSISVRFSNVVLDGRLFKVVKVVKASNRSCFSGDVVDNSISAGSFGVLNNSSINDSNMCLGLWISLEYIVLNMITLDIFVVRYARGAMLW